MHAYDRRGRSRAHTQENRPPPRRDCKYIHAHTEMESAANALTYDGLLLREVGRRDTLAFVCVCVCTRAHLHGYCECKSAAIGLKATQARLSRASFFEFHASSSSHRGVCFMYVLYLYIYCAIVYIYDRFL